jgi:hypothetical protein
VTIFATTTATNWPDAIILCVLIVCMTAAVVACQWIWYGRRDK